MREKRVAQLAQHRAVDDAGHVRAARHFLRGDVNLHARSGWRRRSSRRRPRDRAGPQRVGHAHRAGLAGGIHRVAGEDWCASASCRRGGRCASRRGSWDRSRGMTALAARISVSPVARVNDQRAEGDGMRRFQRARGETHDRAHALFVEGSYAGACGCRGRHVVI